MQRSEQGRMVIAAKQGKRRQVAALQGAAPRMVNSPRSMTGRAGLSVDPRSL